MGPTRAFQLPRCYQDRAKQPHLAPLGQYPDLWFLVGIGCRRLDRLNFVNRRFSEINRDAVGDLHYARYSNPLFHFKSSLVDP